LDLQGSQSVSRSRGIGRYSLDLAQEIARQAGSHEVWVVLSERFSEPIDELRQAFATLIPQERIRVFDLLGPSAESNPANAWRRQAAELIREKFLADLNPDIVHISTLFEGFSDESVASVGRLDSTIPTAVTLYDLIPMLQPEKYLTEPTHKKVYLRRAQALKRADLLFAISASSGQEAIEILQIPPERIVMIGAGVAPWWFEKQILSPQAELALKDRHGLKRPFILYIGGDDPRKNLKGLIAAYATLPHQIRVTYQLAIVCSLPEQTRIRLATIAKEHGLREDEILFLGFIPNDDLRLLYTTCSLFVFPSLHEGFGLPIVEAMACGAPVIGSNCTSIPEIINRNDALFDPKDPRSIADRIHKILSTPGLRESLKQWGQERAKIFTWEARAGKALQAFEALHENRGSAKATQRRTTRPRPLLAFVGPLPPQQSGIANYSAKLLPNLNRHYEIVCIVDQPEVTDSWITSEFAIRDVHWFETNAEKFDYILYHLGNSTLPIHMHMFGLIERHPGVVVLHDFYISDVMSWMTHIGYTHDSFARILYDSHGFSALEKERLTSHAESVATFPCNATVLRNSIGVIVHSQHAIELAIKWFGDRASSHLRQLPFLPYPPEATDRSAARKRLGFHENAFLVCNFGWITPLKLNDRLLEAWIGSPLAKEKDCFLAFVGQNADGDYGKRLSERISNRGADSRIRVTGYCTEEQYRDYLAAADLAVQLRSGSRGETSGTIFDCLSRNLPVITNAHGSIAEFPDDVVTKLEDEFTNATLVSAIGYLRENKELRQKFAKNAVSYVNQKHHPERIGERYREIIEEFYATSSLAREQRLMEALARTPAKVSPTDNDLAGAAAALAANRERFGLAQILVDVTILAIVDARTGIQRVTRAILMALISDPPVGFRIEPVWASGGSFFYARKFAARCLGLLESNFSDDLVETSQGDIFLGVDLGINDVPSLKSWFLKQRRRGIKVFFVVHDLLPIERPQLFPDPIPTQVLDWLNTVTEVADGAVCVSRTVADELHEWLSENNPTRLQALQLGFFHHGADFEASLPSTGVSPDASATLEKLRRRPSFLMVGTIEPRKGHQQALDAMEKLWVDGINANLVIVGKQGWSSDNLVQRIAQHSEYNHRLFWLNGISDEMLDQVYRNTQALLAASVGEGFGLPLIEAARYGLSIIARDIPVFREVAGKHAYYFSGDVDALVEALKHWISIGGNTLSSSYLPWLTWHQSSRQLVDVVLGGKWYKHWITSVTDGEV
jgi:glycosyltransferase involved in cell wall biosynthesis